MTREGGSQAIQSCAICEQMHSTLYSLPLPSKSAGVNNSGRFLYYINFVFQVVGPEDLKEKTKSVGSAEKRTHLRVALSVCSSLAKRFWSTTFSYSAELLPPRASTDCR